MTARLFPSGHAGHPQWRMAAALVLVQLRAQMALPGYARAPSLGLLYITDHFAADAAQLLEYLVQQLPEVRAWSGTVGAGVVANNAEYVDEPALSVMLCDIAPQDWRIVSGIAPLPRLGEAGFEARAALVHADEFVPDLKDVLEELASRTSAGFLFGGVSASRGTRVQFALDLLRRVTQPQSREDESGVLQGGLSGVAFGPQVQWISRVTQSCQPIAPWVVVTASQDNVVLELDGVPALDMLLETLGVTLKGELQPLVETVTGTLIGLLDEGAALPRNSGHLAENARVRDIVGLDTTRRGIALAEPVEVGSLLVFCKRDQNAARADLMRICAEVREALEPDEEVLPAHGSTVLRDDDLADPGSVAEKRIVGAIYVSSAERSGAFFGGANAELQIVRRALGEVPLTGFFARGEVAAHRLFGYTGVLTVFWDEAGIA